MENNKLIARLIRLFFLISILFAVGLALYSGLVQGKKVRQINHNYDVLNGSWEKEERMVRYTATLPQYITEGMQICIQNSDNMIIMVDGDVRKEFSVGEYNLPGDMIKDVYMFCKLSMEDGGKQLVIEKTGDVINETMEHKVYYGDSFGIVAGFLREDAIVYLLVIVLLVISLVIGIGCAILYFVFKRKIALIYLSTGMIFGSLWLIFRAGIFQFVFDDYFLDGPLSFMMLYLIPCPLLEYLNVIQQRRYKNYLIPAEIAILACFAILTGLHFSSGINFKMTQMIFYVVVAGVTVLGFITGCMDQRRGYMKSYRCLASGLLIYFVFTCLEIIDTAILGGRFKGLFFIIGMYVLLVTSVSQQIYDSITIRREKDKAIEANAAKSNFLANMSHEIRTPLNSIIGMNEMILRENDNEQINEYSKHIEKSGKLLLGLISDVLDFSKIEAGKIEINKADFDFKELLEDIISILRERAAQKNLAVFVNIDSKIPLNIHGDDLHIKQVLINILSNAVKYTERGSITFEANLHQLPENGICNVEFVFSDTGIGIKKDAIPHLFDAFKRLDEQKNKMTEGTGLGLSIVYNLVKELGGTINVDSRYGMGSKFSVTLPLEYKGAETIGKVSEIKQTFAERREYKESFHAPDAQILVVDDNKVNLLIVKKLLKLTKVQITTVDNGGDAVKLARNYKFDVIFMDHMMPYPNGIETLHMIKEDMTGLNNETPIIVLTANAISGMRDMYRKEGFEDYLTKPIEPMRLESCLKRYIPEEKIKE